MPRKENTKAKTWERDRRSRMNGYFNSLAELLPPQQDGRKRNKVDIIVHATKYIKELHSRTDNLMQANASKAHRDELLRLKKLVHQLFLRMHLLSNLLQDAGITVPAEPALEKISPLKWSNKINVNTVESYLNNCDIKNKNEKSKEKVVKNTSPKKKSPAKKPNKSNISENQENCVNSKNDKEVETDDLKRVESESKEDAVELSSNNVDNDSVPAVSQSSEKCKKSKLKRKRNDPYLIPTTTTVAVSNFPTGTLVLSGTKIMPVVAPIPSITPNIIMSAQTRPSNSPIILNNAQSSQMFVVQPLQANPVRNSVISIQNQAVINHVPNVIVNPRTWASNVNKIINSTKIGGHKGILPKGRENTKTTMTYKVPIPAIHKEKVDKKDKDSESKSKSSKSNKKQSSNQEENQKNQNSKEKNERKRVATSKIDSSEVQPKKTKTKQNEEKVDSNKKNDSSNLELNQCTSKTKSVTDKLEVEEASNRIQNDHEKTIIQGTSPVIPDLNKDMKNVTLENEIDKTETDVNSNKEITEMSNDIQNSIENKRINEIEVENPEMIEEEKNVSDDSIIPNSEKRNLEIEETVISDSVNEVCNLESNFDNLLESENTEIVNGTIIAESNKILLNLDTNTTTTMKLESSVGSVTSTTLASNNVNPAKSLNTSKDEEEVKHLSYTANNTFVPINKSEAMHSDLSNDIFASLQVPSSSHNPESISPTVAFLTAFPLVSSLSGKAVVLEEEMKDDFNHSQTPPMLLQIGTIEPNSFKIKSSTIDSIENSSPKAIVSSSESKCAESESIKSLPKIVSSETIKEPYKILQPTDAKVNDTVDVNIANSTTLTKLVESSGEVNTVEDDSVSKNVVEESLSTVNVVSNQNNEINQFNTQNKNQSIRSYEIPKDNGTVINENATKFDAQRYPENCPNVCQVECSKDDVVRSNHYDYQVCSLNNYNPRNNEVSFENIHQDYLVRNKTTNFPTNNENIETDCNKSIHQSSGPINQNEKIANNLHSQPTQEHRNENFSSQKKIESTDFQQNISYDSGEKQKSNLPQSKDTINNISESNGSNYQRRSNEAQSSYIDPYGKGGKKIVPNASTSNEKSLPVRSSYSQQQESFVTSNYEENAISRQSTTTVAHNSSNFSILSWTTFSPVNGSNNNNISQFDQNSSQNDLNQSKTICENLNYLSLQKESTSVPNTIPTHSYAPISNSGTYDKSRSKQSMDLQKRSYNDPSKNRNLRPIVSSQKQNRNQTQTQNPVPNSEYNKFSGESNKNKVKYSMDLDYMQSDFLNIDPRQQQPHHQQKTSTSQSIQSVKQDKSNYIIADFDPQAQFDSEQNNTRYNSDIYVSSNFKSQQISPHKSYQVQSQASIPQHNQQQQQSSSNKPKSQPQNTQQQIRPPVNWMMTPEIKHNTTNIGDIILPPIGKELEFCQNNFFSQTPTYNQSAPNQFYNNYDVTAHGFPNIPVLQGDSKRGTESTFYSEEQPFSWSPTKSMPQSIEQSQTLKTIDQHVVPSTLPTLVGDLALGTNLTDKQNFLFTQNPPVRTELGKENVKEKDNNREYQMINNQSAQHQTQGMSFLSVSQLVEQEKAEKQQQHNHHHQQQHHQQQQRKHQRKSNTSPRGGKKQIDIRKQSVNQHDDQKTPSGFTDQNYQQQQQKYQQNEIHWRTRNCKSNYTAEALIGNDGNHQEKNAKYNYPQNKFPGGLHSTDAMMPINYFPNVDNTGGYGQVVNQNFNHSYSYSSNANIYPNTNFITSISNNPTNYMMSLHDNSDYLENNNFLLPPNVATSTSSLSNSSVNAKNQHFSSGKHNQNYDKRSYSTTQKKSKRKTDGTAQNFEFPLSGITSPLDDYHHTTSFLPHTTPLYQNHSQVNVYPKGMNALAPPPPPGPHPAPPPPSSLSLAPSNQEIPAIPPTASGIPATNPMVMHHPSGTSLTNFNLTTIFPEMNDKVSGYKSSANGVPSGLVQSSHATTSYPQRVSYTNSLGHMPQISDSAHFGTDLPRPPTSDIVHYKNP